jgi:hypothetical protein
MKLANKKTDLTLVLLKGQKIRNRNKEYHPSNLMTGLR